MKLVKLKCGTWINPEMVTGIEPFHEQDGPGGATLYHLARLDAVQTEETADELAEILMGVTLLPGGVQISVRPASIEDVAPDPPDHSGMVEAIKTIVNEERAPEATLNALEKAFPNTFKAFEKAFPPGPPDPPMPAGRRTKSEPSSGIEEGKVRKGGKGDKPLHPSPPPPIGQEPRRK